METIFESAASKEIERAMKAGDSLNRAINSAIELLVAKGCSKYDATNIACFTAARDFA